MKIAKFSVILFISILMVAFLPQVVGSVASQNSIQSDQLHRIGPDQAAKQPNFELGFVNASLSNIKRNVTVQFDGKVTLEDQFTLKINDNVTKVSVFNYTIPSAFALYVHEAKIYSQFGDEVGLDSANNSRAYSVYYGQDVTTYSVNIAEDGVAANDTNGPVYFKTAITAVGLLKMSSYLTGQRGEFPAPIVPFFPNLNVKDSIIGLGVAGSEDTWSRSEMNRFENHLGNEMPQFTDTTNRVTYFNMSRTSFSYDEGMIEGDLTTAVFTSTTPRTDTQQDISAVVPTEIKKADRTVRFDPWGKVFITEQITVLHLGAKRNQTNDIYQNLHQLSGILFTVDSDAVITDVYDDQGSLELGPKLRNENTGYPATTASGVPGKQDLRVSFRTAIYGGETTTLTFEYEYNASQVVSIDSSTKQYTLNTTLFSDFNTTMKDLTLRYQLPAGSVYKGNNYHVQSRFAQFSMTSNVAISPLSSFQHFELVFHAKNVSYTDNTGFQIYFTYNYMGHLQFLATYLYVGIIILAAVFAMSTISYKPSRAVEIEKQQIPVDAMETFFNLFSEKSGAEKRIADLRVQRRKGKLTKKDYDGKVKSIRRRLRDINPQLESAAKLLSQKGGRYENYVNRVMLASQRQSDIRRNAREAKKDYERGNIPKNIYQMRIKEFNENLSKEESTINKTLTEMVEVIQRFIQE